MSVQLHKRFLAVKSKKHNWDDLYQDCFRYAAPQRDTFFENKTDGEKKDGKGEVYDSAAITALSKFASNIQSALCPPQKVWAKRIAGASVPDENSKSFQEALEFVDKVFFSAISQSNFDVQIGESFLDLGAGTGALLFQKGTIENPFSFVSIPLSQLYLEGGANGDITGVFRQHEVPIRSIQETWPDARLTDDMTQKMESRPDSVCSLIESTVQEDFEYIDINRGAVKQQIKNGYVYRLMDEKSKTILLERKMRTNPWIIFRWSVMAGEVYGRGVLTQALPDIKSLNRVKELILKNAALAVAGVWTAVDDGVMNVENIKFRPGSIIPVAHNEGSMQGASIAPLKPSGDFNVGQFVLEDLRKSINDMMFADPLGDIDLPVKSATEISMRQQNFLRRIGSSYGRLQNELIIPIMNRGADILQELGLLGDGSDLVIVDGRFVNVEYSSPLSNSSNNEDIMNVTRFFELTAGMLGPQAALAIMKPEMAEYIAQKLGLPLSLIKSSEEIKQVIEALTQMMAAQQNATV